MTLEAIMQKIVEKIEREYADYTQYISIHENTPNSYVVFVTHTAKINNKSKKIDESTLASLWSMINYELHTNVQRDSYREGLKRELETEYSVNSDNDKDTLKETLKVTLKEHTKTNSEYSIERTIEELRNREIL